jgi:hypothetical protein
MGSWSLDDKNTYIVKFFENQELTSKKFCTGSFKGEDVWPVATIQSNTKGRATGFYITIPSTCTEIVKIANHVEKDLYFIDYKDFDKWDDFTASTNDNNGKRLNTKVRGPQGATSVFNIMFQYGSIGDYITDDDLHKLTKALNGYTKTRIDEMDKVKLEAFNSAEVYNNDLKEVEKIDNEIKLANVKLENAKTKAAGAKKIVETNSAKIAKTCIQCKTQTTDLETYLNATPFKIENVKTSLDKISVFHAKTNKK